MDGYTKEELKLVYESRKILHLPDLLVTPIVAARVPVERGHSEAVVVEFDQPLSPAEAAQVLRETAGIIVGERPEARQKKIAKTINLIVKKFSKIKLLWK